MHSLKTLADQDLAYVEVSSEVNKGTLVRLHLYAPSLLSTNQAESSVEQTSSHIIVVDDDEFVGDMLVSILRKLGYSADWYSNPESALEIINKTNIGLVITDLNMPQLSGDRLAKDIKRSKPDLPIVIYSGQAASIRPNPIYSAILKKPISPSKLNTIIENLLPS